MMESIEGIGTVYVQRTDYVNKSLLLAYTQNILDFKSTMDRITAPDYTFSSDDYRSIVFAIQGLANLAKNGKEGGDPSNPNVGYFNGDMADHLKEIMSYFKVVGIDSFSSLDIPNSEKEAKIEGLQTLSTFGLKDLLVKTIALYPTYTQTVDPKTGKVLNLSTESTMQSLVETEYIKNGNDLIGTQLDGLQTALELTNRTLDILTNMQNIMNMITIDPRTGTLTIPTTTDMTAFKTQYKSAASVFFRQLIPRVLSGTTVATDLYKSKQQLFSTLLKLEAINPQATRKTPDTLAANIFAVITDISAQFNAISNSVNKDTLLLNPTAFEAKFKSAAVKWIMDGQNLKISDDTAGNSGRFQSHLSTAISTAETLNDKQRDDVRRYLYIFEEFYKSATKMLEILSETIEKMAQRTVKK